MSTNLIPFLEMNGSANEAIALYEKALDAKVVYKLRLGDVPKNPESPLPPEKEDLISYAILKIGDAELQISDLVTGSNYHKGTQITLVVQTPDKDKAVQYFEALKEGGQVNEPLQASFFSPAYGNVTDKFGVTFRILTKGRQ
ncbi:VOC family protein [Paenibacillus sp. PR3]|uniref:VOC family protein n=1 Tax=Paenibacillus terricola TaxID=2763503 RepID=A0ABR8N4F4_9BACL|nr:VOC family protein [Paenibacillus terricola]MBD3921719.1 VOC family protein [Paenibacillus terricola]